MKRLYLIQYKPLNTSVLLETRIKSIGAWVKFFESTWIVESTLTAEQIYAQFSVDFKDLSIIILEVKKENYFGRMNTTVWDYIKSKK